MSVNVAILGATGYTGSELIRLVHRHPNLSIRHLAAHSQAGKTAGNVLPGLGGKLADMVLAQADDTVPNDVALVFTALPHGAAANSVKRALDAGKRVVDLSADFRHRNRDIYARAYSLEHPHPELLNQAEFGLTEFTRDKIRGAALVANPGCYPTATLLPLVPLLAAGVIDTDGIIVDAKSGASGAGRSASIDLQYCEVNENVRAYGLPRHRHVWEMEEWAHALSGQQAKIRFVAHILPMTRGMLATLHLKGKNAAAWHSILSNAYAGENFVRVLPEGMLPQTSAVCGSNRCDLGISVTADSEAVVVSCLDNLIKGAAGQAVQNANVMLGWEEALGLEGIANWP